ncbi:hypothetical protein EON64_10460 [archaeon]|nr:MAG: hypothetical protein EON64_10460 [archaeon]
MTDAVGATTVGDPDCTGRTLGTVEIVGKEEGGIDANGRAVGLTGTTVGAAVTGSDVGLTGTTVGAAVTGSDVGKTGSL